MQDAAAAKRRDLYTQQLIADAHGPVESLPLESEGPFDDKPQPTTFCISLEGEGAEAYEEFRLTAKALAQHNADGAAVMEAYRAALARLSAAAVK